MGSTWQERFSEYIYNIHQDLPVDASLENRIKALRDNMPSDARTTSWGRKSWQKARREYLKRYGYMPKTGAANHESPLEKLMSTGKAV